MIFGRQKTLNVVFMGTPDFAVPVLNSLVEAGMALRAVVTRPDRPRGRGKRVRYSPVKEEALRFGLPVYQPHSVREEHFIALLRELNPDVIAVAAFGQILPSEILNIPPLGCINVHASLLPEYRGAAPIQRAVMSGRSETGVTIMKMDTGLDTGDILLQERAAISPEDSFGSLYRRLSLMGAGMLPEALHLLASGRLRGVPQDSERATYAPPLRREEEIINWSGRAVDIENLVRGLDPWPGARTWLGERVLKIWRASVAGGERAAGGTGPAAETPLPGQVLRTGGPGLVVQCKDRPLAVRELQLEGGKRLAAEDFLRGVRIVPGAVLGWAEGPDNAGGV